MLTHLLHLRRTLVNMIIPAYMSTQLCLWRTRFSPSMSLLLSFSRPSDDEEV